ncbi:MAG TPA: S49 family peptidase, partial [Cytophagaceae bacterium]
MLSFLKYVFATIVGLFLFILLFIAIIAGIISSTVDKKEEANVGQNSVLKLNLNKAIEERETDNFFGSIGGPFSQREGSLGLLELRQSIDHASQDENIKGILLEVSNTAAGMATLQELRNALKDFKKSGKFIVAYGETYSEASYYLASVADKIFLPPPGLLELNGLESEIMFFKGTLEKLELKPEVFKVGEFKSAVEPFILEKMSEPNKLQLTSFLNSIYNHLLSDISVSRNIPVERLKLISDSMLIRNSEDALKEKLVTDLGYLDNVDDFLKERLKVSKTEDVNYVSLASYENSLTPTENSTNDIAVIYATGGIESGKGDAGTIGSESLARELRKARKDEKIKAVVLRINSPGGSALA